MPYLISTCFNEFLDAISITGNMGDVALTRSKSIASYLESSFEILDIFATGSLTRGTALRGSSDIDVMVVLHYSKHIKGKSPRVVLVLRCTPGDKVRRTRGVKVVSSDEPRSGAAPLLQNARTRNATPSVGMHPAVAWWSRAEVSDPSGKRTQVGPARPKPAPKGP
jgi:hypothetical protein